MPFPPGRSLCILRCAVLLLLSSCSSYRGVSEFSAYRDAYSAAASLGNSILDQLAVAERNLYKVAYPFDPTKDEFIPAHSRYLVEPVDPPATSAYRRTLVALTTVNEALYDLSSGSEAQAIAGKFAKLAALSTAAVADVAFLAPSTALAKPLTAPLAITINKTLSNFQPVAAPIIGFYTRKRFQEKLLADAGTVRKALGEIRDSTPTVFNLLRVNVIAQANADPSRMDGLNKEEKARIDRYQTINATWVVLLEAAITGLERTEAAIKSKDQASSFEGVLQASEDLASAVSSARRQLAAVQ